MKTFEEYLVEMQDFRSHKDNNYGIKKKNLKKEKFCIKCGKEIPDDKDKCLKCRKEKD